MVQLLTTTANAAQMLGIGRTKLFELLRLGQIQAVRLGRKTLIPIKELEQFAAALPARGSKQPTPQGDRQPAQRQRLRPAHGATQERDDGAVSSRERVEQHTP